MCGRFIQVSNPEKIQMRISELEISSAVTTDFKPRYNIAPTQNIITILNHPKPKMVYTRWGLIPFWAKDKTIGNKMINAREETLLEKPSFRTLLKKQRCILFTDGFYEWKKTDKTKTPYFIHFKNSEPFALAGLWDNWVNKDTGETIQSSTIITGQPNDLIEDIHTRMPVILKPEDYATWLSAEPQSDQSLINCLLTYPSEGMETYVISKLINSPANDTPECIKPYGDPEIIG